jgi:hypothetical protein
MNGFPNGEAWAGTDSASPNARADRHTKSSVAGAVVARLKPVLRWCVRRIDQEHRCHDRRLPSGFWGDEE